MSPSTTASPHYQGAVAQACCCTGQLQDLHSECEGGNFARCNPERMLSNTQSQHQANTSDAPAVLQHLFTALFAAPLQAHIACQPHDQAYSRDSEHTRFAHPAEVPAHS
eukprot:3608-Heterococcus_DN1.PRE.1